MPGGRPKKQIPLEYEPPQPQTRSRAEFKNRQDVELFVQESLAQTHEDLEFLKCSIRAIIDALELALTHQAGPVNLEIISALTTQQQRYRQVLKDDMDILQGLIKEFALLRALDKPKDEDDGRFAPVTLVLNLGAPNGA